MRRKVWLHHLEGIFSVVFNTFFPKIMMCTCAGRMNKQLCVCLKRTWNISRLWRAKVLFGPVQEDTWFVGGVNYTSKLEVLLFIFRKQVQLIFNGSAGDTAEMTLRKVVNILTSFSARSLEEQNVTWHSICNQILLWAGAAFLCGLWMWHGPNDRLMHIPHSSPCNNGFFLSGHEGSQCKLGASSLFL